ncbi:MAG: bifunctional phosphoglucose/phosphomannose isomerase [Candidatus Tectomicrobia bacterium]|uniref:Bifunctional phosphoglucose/phosphomannose isomerase n=1 Tax=Tectimicrobiota bacterium TaxID=2528274 RepID=A0A932CQL9_UNCTE|nr:bifunctional phosphoglucose/phosphomannose isomerase [Candidatus Tectomicrobia bacterium]
MIQLDDQTVLKQIDRSDMERLLTAFPLQCQQGVRAGREANLRLAREHVRQIMIAGMGGSAIGGDLLRTYLRSDLPIPLWVIRNYHLPQFASPETLVFIVSYSGNTEETLSVFRDALQAGCQVVALTSGGMLRQECQAKGLPVISIPAGLPPRAALGYLFFPLLAVLEGSGLIPPQGEALQEIEGLLPELSQTYGPQQLTAQNPAKQLALRLQGRLPLIYGSQDHTEAVALRWKGQLNENSKQIAVCNVFPELNHNEIMGWEAAGEIMRLALFLFLRDVEDHPRVARRMEITAEIAAQHGGEVIHVSSQGKSRLARLFSLIYGGDFVSYYLALAKGVDPTPVASIDSLKKALDAR